MTNHASIICDDVNAVENNIIVNYTKVIKVVL